MDGLRPLSGVGRPRGIVVGAVATLVVPGAMRARLKMAAFLRQRLPASRRPIRKLRRHDGIRSSAPYPHRIPQILKAWVQSKLANHMRVACLPRERLVYA